jgi:hypothetical protein
MFRFADIKFGGKRFHSLICLQTKEFAHKDLPVNFKIKLVFGKLNYDKISKWMLEDKTKIMLAIYNTNFIFEDMNKVEKLCSERLFEYMHTESMWKLILIYTSLPKGYYGIPKKKRIKFDKLCSLLIM